MKILRLLRGNWHELITNWFQKRAILSNILTPWMLSRPSTKLGWGNRKRNRATAKKSSVNTRSYCRTAVCRPFPTRPDLTATKPPSSTSRLASIIPRWWCLHQPSQTAAPSPLAGREQLLPPPPPRHQPLQRRPLALLWLSRNRLMTDGRSSGSRSRSIAGRAPAVDPDSAVIGHEEEVNDFVPLKRQQQCRPALLLLLLSPVKRPAISRWWLLPAKPTMQLESTRQSHASNHLRLRSAWKCRGDSTANRPTISIEHFVI